MGAQEFFYALLRQYRVAYRQERQQRKRDLADIGRDEISDELFHVVVDGAPFLDRGDDRREVVISKHHLRG